CPEPARLFFMMASDPTYCILRVSIHRTSWKGCSPKYVCSILH
ncbi:MAG: hypothetical protein AVDCRST_MAG12-1299, partial [uncultured Rubrobacteraceae bacterium]